MREMIDVESLSLEDLDYYVAKAEDLRVFINDSGKRGHWVHTDWDGDDDFPIPSYSTDFQAGGEIIEEYGISLESMGENEWRATILVNRDGDFYKVEAEGPTFLIAAMRALVAGCLEEDDLEDL